MKLITTTNGDTVAAMLTPPYHFGIVAAPPGLGGFGDLNMGGASSSSVGAGASDCPNEAAQIP